MLTQMRESVHSSSGVAIEKIREKISELRRNERNSVFKTVRTLLRGVNMSEEGISTGQNARRVLGEFEFGRRLGLQALGVMAASGAIASLTDISAAHAATKSGTDQDWLRVTTNGCARRLRGT